MLALEEPESVYTTHFEFPLPCLLAPSYTAHSRHHPVSAPRKSQCLLTVWWTSKQNRQTKSTPMTHEGTQVNQTCPRSKVSTPWFISTMAQTLLVPILEECPKEAGPLRFSKQIYISLPLVFNILPLYFLCWNGIFNILDLLEWFPCKFRMYIFISLMPINNIQTWEVYTLK